MDELANVYEVIDLYNQVISSYSGNNAVQTKQTVFSTTRRLLTYVLVIARGLIHMIEKYAANPDQLQNGNMYFISAHELQHRLNTLLTKRCIWYV